MKRRAKPTTRKRRTSVRTSKSSSRKKSTTGGAVREYFLLNPDFEFFKELRTFVLKPSSEERVELIRRINGLGRVKLAVVSGVFLNTVEDSALDTEAAADLFIVGDDINKRKLTAFLQSLEAEVGKEIKFGLMEREEFLYRFGMFDRFVRVLLEGPHEKIINKLGI